MTAIGFPAEPLVATFSALRDTGDFGAMGEVGEVAVGLTAGDCFVGGEMTDLASLLKLSFVEGGWPWFEETPAIILRPTDFDGVPETDLLFVRGAPGLFFWRVGVLGDSDAEVPVRLDSDTGEEPSKAEPFRIVPSPPLILSSTASG
ncbi:hypothetical protein HC762_00645 [bacterium]|nr:hypothetical protein [bacterium]